MRLPLLPLVWMLTACVITRPNAAPDVSPAEHYLRYGVAAFADGQSQTAAIRFRQALELAEERGDDEEQIRAHINLAELTQRSRDLQKTAYHLQQAARLNTRVQNAQFQRRIGLLESSMAIQRRDYARAEDLLETLCEAPVDGDAADAVTVAALTNRAIVAEATQAGDLAHWVQRLKQVLASAGGDDPALRGRLERFDARLAIDAGDPDRADDHYRQALAYYEQARQELAVGVTLSRWAQLDVGRGYLQAARDKLKRSILMRDAAGDRDGVIDDLNTLAGVELQLGHNEESAALQRFAAALRKSDNPAIQLRENLAYPNN